MSVTRFKSMVKILNPREAGDCLMQGGLVAFPTETVYGLGADALNEEAVARLYAAKNRPSYNPLICHLKDAKSVFQYGESDKIAVRLARYWPGPLTLLLPHKGRIPQCITAGSSLCGFRVPDHPAALDMLAHCNRPIAAPSANRSGKRSPVTADMVEEQLGDHIDGIVNGGRCRLGMESTVVLPQNDGLRILRPGALSSEQLQEDGFKIFFTGDDPQARFHVQAKFDPQTMSNLQAEIKTQTEPLHSPGQLDRHYAPRTPLLLIRIDPLGTFDGITFMEEIHRYVHERMGSNRNICLIEFGRENGNDLAASHSSTSSKSTHTKFVTLSKSGDANEAGHNLYALFDQLDRQDFDIIIAVELPEHGMGRAINDRLRRASTFRVSYQNGELYTDLA